jgi:hypothetical protein
MTTTRERVRTFGKSATEQVRVERTSFKGREYINARIWFQDERGEWHPTQKGLTLTPELAEEVAQAMLEAARLDSPGYEGLE